MGDFVEQTAVEEIGDRRYRSVLDSDWMTWGPAGGYVAATALRAAGEATSFDRPASFACQYLSVARFDAVELSVETLRAGRSTEALRVSMTQDGKPILEASVWAVGANEGLEHDYTRPPDVPPPEELSDIRELQPDRPQRGFFQNLERRPIDWLPEDELKVREPVMRGWYRFRPRACGESRFVDAARAVILIDSFTWPATWPAHPSPGPSPWIAPNLDLYVRFHHDARPFEWLLSEARADLAADGRIGTEGTVWSPKGQLIAAGSSQLFCRPRPERFR
jgi:acyl-CoA thioesterase II